VRDKFRFAGVFLILSVPFIESHGIPAEGWRCCFGKAKYPTRQDHGQQPKKLLALGKAEIIGSRKAGPVLYVFRRNARHFVIDGHAADHLLV